MSKSPILGPRPSTHRFVRALLIVAAVALGARPAHAQGRDSLWNGTLIGAAVGAGVGVALTHAVRDSELSFEQYAYGALAFGAIGAGAGLGVDALLSRSTPGPGIVRRRVLIAPAVWRGVAGVNVRWRW